MAAAAASEEGCCDPVGLRALRSLGLGFDLTSDFRLGFAKGYPHRRLVELDERRTRELVLPSGPAVSGVSCDIGCDKGDRMRFRSDVLEFNKMSELLNQKSSIQGKVPSGYFNALFDLSGVWLEDAKETKNLAFDGYFISLYNLYLRASPLVLRDEVKMAIPSKWDPVMLSRFIQEYGTHIVIEIAVGGQDVVCVRQNASSKFSPAELKLHLEDLGDILFMEDGKRPVPLHRSREGKDKAPEVFTKILQSTNLPLATHSESSSKDGLTVICSKRGGNAFLNHHSQWLQTVSYDPDAILFKFVPITSLLPGIPGNGYLSHAINLYLRYKPDPEDLLYFLEFQVPRQWGPMYNELSLGPQRRKGSYPSLQFRFLGPKLHVNTEQVSSDRKPVVGLRLYLEGKQCNRLAIHVQHLSGLPSMLNPSPSSWPCRWRGSEDSDAGFLEPIQWNSHSSVCTAAVEHDPGWLREVPDGSGVFVVTGAQLVARGRWPKKELHLRLLFTHLPKCDIRRTAWAESETAASRGTSLLTYISTTLTLRDATPAPKREPWMLNSGAYLEGPPVPVHSRKLLRFVDMAEVVRGPEDAPGHWLVTAARLVRERGKVGLHVKFALLNYHHSEAAAAAAAAELF